MAYTREKPPSSFMVGLLEWIEIFTFAAVAALFLLSFAITSVLVQGDSMLPGLENGDSLIATAYVGVPRRGDIVVSIRPHDETRAIIKRVIGLPGDKIDIDFHTGDVFVNDRLLVEGYLAAPTLQPGDVQFPLTVPRNQVFLMGDNRAVSWDSRSSAVGTVDIRYLRGVALFRIFPLPRMGAIYD